MTEQHIVVFDGVCNFCNGAVNFIIARDTHNKFVFTPMQSDFGKKLVEQYSITNVGVDTFLLVKNQKCHIWTDAALEITKDLSGFWFMFNLLRVIPRPVRDFFYRLFARNRYTLFGKSEHCMIPTKELRSKFKGC